MKPIIKKRIVEIIILIIVLIVLSMFAIRSEANAKMALFFILGVLFMVCFLEGMELVKI